MAEGARQAVDDGALVVRLPVDADHPIRNAVLWAVVLGVAAFGFVVFDRRGLGGPVSIGVPVGGATVLVAGPLIYLALRRRSRGHRLVCDDDGIAFAVSDATRWRVPWDAVQGAQIVDATLTYGGRTRPAASTFLVLDLDPDAAPDHPSLPRHEGRWWFSLLRAEQHAPRIGDQLRRRLPGRVDRAAHRDGIPHELATREDTPSRMFR